MPGHISSLNNARLMIEGGNRAKQLMMFICLFRVDRIDESMKGSKVQRALTAHRKDVRATGLGGGY
jgi:hypothetical protein